VKKSEFKALLKEEIKRVLTENMFEVGEEVMYMGEPHRVSSDNGYVIKLVSKKRGTKVTLNYSQAKEKIQSLNENQDLRNSYVEDIIPGKYEIGFTVDNGSGGDEYVVNITQDMLDEAIEKLSKDNTGKTPSFNFWIGLVEDHYLFGSGDRVQYIKKLESQPFNESLTLEEEEEFHYIEDELRYAVNSRSAINPKMVARYKVLLSKKNETSDK
jgi:hypothetical protein